MTDSWNCQHAGEMWTGFCSMNKFWMRLEYCSLVDLIDVVWVVYIFMQYINSFKLPALFCGTDCNQDPHARFHQALTSHVAYNAEQD